MTVGMVLAAFVGLVVIILAAIGVAALCAMWNWSFGR